MSDGPKWFAPKRFGYGAGLPIAWQGWAILLAYVAIAALVSATAHDRYPIVLAIMVPATVVLLVVTARTHSRRLALALGE